MSINQNSNSSFSYEEESNSQDTFVKNTRSTTTTPPPSTNHQFKTSRHNEDYEEDVILNYNDLPNTNVKSSFENGKKKEPSSNPDISSSSSSVSSFSTFPSTKSPIISSDLSKESTSNNSTSSSNNIKSPSKKLKVITDESGSPMNSSSSLKFSPHSLINNSVKNEHNNNGINTKNFNNNSIAETEAAAHRAALSHLTNNYNNMTTLFNTTNNHHHPQQQPLNNQMNNVNINNKYPPNLPFSHLLPPFLQQQMASGMPQEAIYNPFFDYLNKSNPSMMLPPALNPNGPGAASSAPIDPHKTFMKMMVNISFIFCTKFEFEK